MLTCEAVLDNNVLVTALAVHKLVFYCVFCLKECEFNVCLGALKRVCADMFIVILRKLLRQIEK